MSLFHPKTRNIANGIPSSIPQFSNEISNINFEHVEKEEINWLAKMKKVLVLMQALVLAMHTLSLIHEGTILQRGGGLDDAKVIKVSKQVNVKSGSNSDLFPCQRIMSLIYSDCVPLSTCSLAWTQQACRKMNISTLV